MKKRAVTKKSKSKTRKPVKKTYTHHPDHYNRSEIFLIDNKAPDLQEAWFKIREFGEAQGPKKIYASGRAIMFSKKVCYFFVRPKKTFLETVVFLSDKKLRDGFSTVRPSTIALAVG